jgi:hypothetical protein
MVHWSLIVAAYIAGALSMLFFIDLAAAGRGNDNEDR